MPSHKTLITQQLGGAQGNAAHSLWVWLQEALKTEYPSPTDWDDETALWKSVSEACQYLRELATWPGVYSYNLLGPGIELFAPSMKSPILEGAPFALKGPVISLLGAAAGKKTVGEVILSLRQLAIIRLKKKRQSLKHFKCSSSRSHENILLHCLIRARLCRWHNHWHRVGAACRLCF